MKKGLSKLLIIIAIFICAGFVIVFVLIQTNNSSQLNDPESMDQEYDLTPMPFVYNLNIEKIEAPIQYSDVTYNIDNSMYGYGGGYVREKNSDKLRFVYSKHYTEAITLLPPKGSHEYNGYKIEFASDDETLDYIGLKISNKDIVHNFKVEVGFDGRDGMGMNVSHPLAFIQTACACGPGILVDIMGNVDLKFIAQSGNISWFSLKKSLPFPNGARMQIYYQSAGKSGNTDVQLHSLVLAKKNASNSREVVFNTAPAYVYRVAFVDESVGNISIQHREGALDVQIRNAGKDTIIFDESTLSYLFEKIIGGGLEQLNIKLADGTVKNSLSREYIIKAIRDRIINSGESYVIYNFGNIEKNKILYIDYESRELPRQSFPNSLEITKNETRIYNWNMQNAYESHGKSRILYLITTDANGKTIVDTSLISRNYIFPAHESFWTALGIKRDNFLVTKALNGPAATLEGVTGGIVKAGLTRDSVESYIKKTGGMVFDEKMSANNEKISLYRYGDTVGYIKRVGDLTAVFEVNRSVFSDPKTSDFIIWFVNNNPVSVD